MSKCPKCAASWSTAGLALCPICGTRVAAEPSQAKLEPELAGARTTSTSTSASARKSAILKLTNGGDAKPEPELKVTTFPKPPPPPLALVPKPKEPPPKKEEPPLEEERMDLPKVEKPLRVSTRLVDASVALLTTGPSDEQKLPKPARPLNGPLILGVLALVTGVLLPITVAFESHRIVGVLGFCLSGFFVPFPPIAWIAGLIAEKRRREQGLQPEGRVVLGRRLGQWGTLLLVAEVTILLILVAGLRLAGDLPPTFWGAARQ